MFSLFSNNQRRPLFIITHFPLRALTVGLPRHNCTPAMDKTQPNQLVSPTTSALKSVSVPPSPTLSSSAQPHSSPPDQHHREIMSSPSARPIRPNATYLPLAAHDDDPKTNPDSPSATPLTITDEPVSWWRIYSLCIANFGINSAWALYVSSNPFFFFFFFFLLLFPRLHCLRYPLANHCLLIIPCCFFSPVPLFKSTPNLPPYIVTSLAARYVFKSTTKTKRKTTQESQSF